MSSQGQVFKLEYKEPKVPKWLDAWQIHALYSQGKNWINKERETIVIKEMDDRYLVNLNNFIDSNHERHFMFSFLNMRPMEARGDMAQFSLEQEESRMFHDFDGWSQDIETSPLKRAIRDELKRRKLDDGSGVDRETEDITSGFDSFVRRV